MAPSDSRADWDRALHELLESLQQIRMTKRDHLHRALSSIVNGGGYNQGDVRLLVEPNVSYLITIKVDNLDQAHRVKAKLLSLCSSLIMEVQAEATPRLTVRRCIVTVRLICRPAE